LVVASPSEDERVSVAAVYGGGGLFGIGFALGVTESLIDGGATFRHVPSLGTSAGSWASAGLALDVSFLDAIDRIGGEVPRVPDPRQGRLHAIAAELFGDETRCPTVRVVASALPTFGRTVLSGAVAPIADLVAASSAVPGMLPPHRVGSRRYVDGGIRSMASVDLATDADVLLVLLPIAGPMFGPGGRVMERRSRRELATWYARNPGARAFVVRPTPEVAALARRPDQLFDPERAQRCYEYAYKEGVSLRNEWIDAVGAAS
jgi:NTE family protein